MKKCVFAVGVLVFVLGGCQTTPRAWSDARAAGWNQYGPHDAPPGRMVAIGALDERGDNVVIEGTVSEVCLTKGCWMRVRDEAGDEVFVRFWDYSFFVPTNCTGHRVIAHGFSRQHVVSVDALQHYAHDARKSPEEIAAITQPETRIQFMADSVLIEGPGLKEPFRK